MPNPALSPEITQAMQRRQQGSSTPAMQQVSPQATTSNPVPQPATSSSLNQDSAPSAEAPTMPKFEPQNRKDLITMALIEQLKNDNKLDKEKMKMAVQPQPEPAQSSVAPPPQASLQQPTTGGMGGGGQNSTFSLSPGFNQPMARNQMQGNYLSGNFSGLNNYGKGI